MPAPTLFDEILSPQARLQLGCQVYDARHLRTHIHDLAAATRVRQPDFATPLAVTADSRGRLVAGILLAHQAGVPVLPLPARHSEHRGLLQQCAIERSLQIDENRFPANSAPQPPAAAPPSGQARLLVATGGSGGQPRVVMLGTEQILAAARRGAEATDLGPGDGWLIPLPCHHIGGLAALYRGLCAGCHVRILEPANTAGLLTALRDKRITHVSLVPTQLARLLQLDRPIEAPPQLRCVLVGGAPPGEGLLERARSLGWPVRVAYGMSETCAMVCLDGEALGETRLTLAVDGRIRIHGPSVMQGYARPDLVPGLGLETDGGYLSNDLGRFDDHGRLHIIGRADNALLSGGETLYPEPIEAALSACPGVSEAVITALPDEVWGQSTTLLYRGIIGAQAMTAWCRDHLPPHWRPKSVFRVQELPRTSAGKLDRPRLLALAREIASG